MAGFATDFGHTGFSDATGIPNVLVGMALSILIFGEGEIASFTRVTAWWFLVMTVAAVAFLFVRGQLRRREGLVLIGAYGIFVCFVLFWQ